MATIESRTKKILKQILNQIYKNWNLNSFDEIKIKLHEIRNKDFRKFEMKKMLEKFLDKKILENSKEIETDYKEERLIKIEHEIENVKLIGYYYELEKYSDES